MPSPLRCCQRRRPGRIGVSMLIVLWLLDACLGPPRAPSTGDVVAVEIQETLIPPTVPARVGDQVRWINERRGEVQIVFLTPIDDQVSCKKGFGSFGSVVNAAWLKPRDHVGLCFSKTGLVRYIVRLDTLLPSGERHLQGSIEVAPAKSGG